MIKIWKNDATMVTWMCNVRLEENTIRECLENRRLQLFGHLEKWKKIDDLVHVESSWLVVTWLKK